MKASIFVLAIFVLFISNIAFSVPAQDEKIEVISDQKYSSYLFKNKRESIDIIDYMSPIRNQDVIGSCQSFAFNGIIENRVFQKFGVRLDLSERYQLFLNFFAFGTMGTQMPEIAQFPSLVEQNGVLFEEMYPYDVILKNASRLDLDAAQALGANSKPEIISALEGLNPQQRIPVIQQDKYLGAIPNNPTPFEIPLKVNDQIKQSRYVYDKVSKLEVPCFANPDEKTKGGLTNPMLLFKLQLTPSEFTRHCLQHAASEYAIVTVDQAFADVQNPTQVCQNEMSRTHYASLLAGKRLEALQLVVKNLLRKQSSLIGFQVPDTFEARGSALWKMEGASVFAGHAVVALGVLSKDELMDIKEQDRGLLGSGTFDRLAKALDPNYPSAMSVQLMLKNQQMQTRLNSKLGQSVVKEQGIIVIRNSWGDDVGYQGYQALTFDYLLSEASYMSLSVKLPAVSSDVIKYKPIIKVEHAKQARNFIDNICTSLGK